VAHGIEQVAHKFISNEPEAQESKAPIRARVSKGQGQTARSSVAGAEAAATPANVARLRELMGSLYSVADVAAALGTTSRTVLGHIKTGRLGAVRLGNTWGITEEAFLGFIHGGSEK
jgi:excisionase family DNA binding protein